MFLNAQCLKKQEKKHNKIYLRTKIYKIKKQLGVPVNPTNGLLTSTWFHESRKPILNFHEFLNQPSKRAWFVCFCQNNLIRENS